ncbi:MAG: PfaB family protein, partial [Bacteroidota bacterium]
MELPFQNIIHTPYCREEYDGLIDMHRFPIAEQPDITFYSSRSNNGLLLDSQTVAENSTEVCCNSVDFPKIVQDIFRKGHPIFIEVGANATCTGWISSILKEENHLAVATNKNKRSDGRMLMELLAKLASHGVRMDLSMLFEQTDQQKKTRSFNKKIIPGGARIYDVLLSDKMKALVGQRQLAVAGNYADTVVTATVPPVRTAPTVSAVAKQGNGSLPATPPSNNSIESKPPMEIKTATPVANDDKIVLGENGLRIYDFTTGEHLQGKDIVFSQEDLEEFANGKIAKVFGDEYHIIDSYPRRVMLPKYPYLLVSRVTELRGKIHEYKPSFMQTEYDIPHDAWFTTDRQIPWAVSVESGQCDLLLISYLGIDFQNQGKLVYRLLDCTLTFVDDLPFEGQTLRYDISINSFVRNGDNLLFFFSYRCYVQ